MNEGLSRNNFAVTPPRLWMRLYSVWYRHFRVYTKNFISNGLPPFIEPLFFLAGVGLGLGKYVGVVEGTSYIMFLAAGIIVPPAMYTSAYECTFGTFIRLEFDRVYDGMISASITVCDLLIGEMIFAGTKSLFFSFAVLVIVSAFGLITSPLAVFAPVVGFFTGLMFAAFSLFITYFVKNINHFNFYFTGLLTPMFFFSGIVFPLADLPRPLQVAAEFFPLTHPANLVRALCSGNFSSWLVFDIAYMAVFTAFFGMLSVVLLKKRILQ
ncbi:MAG TPA: ABC transporter permease [Spirochaetota bacterium]|nr:ABC transporter permease [Spirochaetota bacterium]HPI89606.1 ABC transporter permease [Spirochaetota bacterium]HPR48065.1 ABC transporter permease [Spirochaetota bacterium]